MLRSAGSTVDGCVALQREKNEPLTSLYLLTNSLICFECSPSLASFSFIGVSSQTAFLNRPSSASCLSLSSVCFKQKIQFYNKSTLCRAGIRNHDHHNTSLIPYLVDQGSRQQHSFLQQITCSSRHIDRHSTPLSRALWQFSKNNFQVIIQIEPKS